jgi:hypothetical protein
MLYMESCTSCYDPVMAGRKYLNDYEIVTQPDKHGRETTKLEYRGDFFEVLFQKGDLARYRKTSLLVLMITLVLHFSAGFINNDGMRQFYVAIPYATVFLPFFYFSAGLVNLPGKQPPYRRDQVELSFKRIQSANLYLFLLLAVVVIGECAYLLFFASGGNPRLDHLFLLLELFAVIALGLYLPFHKSIHLKKLSKE